MIVSDLAIVVWAGVFAIVVLIALAVVVSRYSSRLPFEVILSSRARELAPSREEAQALVELVVSEMTETVPDGRDPTDIVFHVFSEDEDRHWMVLPTAHDGTLMVAPARFVEMADTANAGGNFGPGGALEGMRIMVPEPDLTDSDRTMLPVDDDDDEDR